nr:MAG TPA: hypothetical protein [Caudoviricetes sp.]
MTRFLPTLVCTFVLSSCAVGTAPRKPEPIPPELIPAGFTASDCHIAKPAEADVDEGPGGNKYSHGERGPKVECSHHSNGAVISKSTPTCHTKGGKELPLADCCMTESGELIPACTPKVQPAGE